MVHNSAHFQQFCHPGSKGNRFSSGEEVPRCEAACAVCAQKDYLEHRHKLHLFGTAPSACGAVQPADDEASDMGDVSEGGADAGRTGPLLKHCGVYYVQSPTLVHKLLDVDRYSQRWPLIPREELQRVKRPTSRPPGMTVAIALAPSACRGASSSTRRQASMRRSWRRRRSGLGLLGVPHRPV